MLIQSVDNQTDPYLMESAVFATKSLIDALETDKNTIEFLKVVIEKLLTNKLTT